MLNVGVVGNMTQDFGSLKGSFRIGIAVVQIPAGDTGYHKVISFVFLFVLSEQIKTIQCITSLKKKKATEKQKGQYQTMKTAHLPGNIDNMISSPSLGTDPLKKLFQWRN